MCLTNIRGRMTCRWLPTANEGKHCFVFDSGSQEVAGSAPVWFHFCIFFGYLAAGSWSTVVTVHGLSMCVCVWGGAAARKQTGTAIFTASKVSLGVYVCVSMACAVQLLPPVNKTA